MAFYHTPNFTDMAARWPSSHVAREKVAEFSGGLINPRTLANLDSKGEGPTEKIRMGRKIGYPVHSLIEWMERRCCVDPKEVKTIESN